MNETDPHAQDEIDRWNEKISPSSDMLDPGVGHCISDYPCPRPFDEWCLNCRDFHKQSNDNDVTAGLRAMECRLTEQQAESKGGR